MAWGAVFEEGVSPRAGPAGGTNTRTGGDRAGDHKERKNQDGRTPCISRSKQYYKNNQRSYFVLFRSILIRYLLLSRTKTPTILKKRSKIVFCPV